jgi:hypothetical protein
MLAIFCARVALGMIACLLLLSPRQLHPRFFRTQFLTALALLVVATATTRFDVGPWPRGLLVAAVLSLLGSLSWTLDPAPAGRWLVVATVGMLIAALGAITHCFLLVMDDLTSAALLGSFMTAMLVGHSYLINPGMALTPLMRCLFVGGLALVARVGVIGWGLGRWTAQNSSYNMDNEAFLELPVRWLVGVLAPLVFGLMAYSAARIRSTQSATGILYVVVVCVFLGELLGLLLTRQTGLPL